MTKLTKADIDGLVDGLQSQVVQDQPMPRETFSTFALMTGVYRPRDLKRAFYLVAGLQADGSPRPEQADVWCRDEPRRWLATGTWDGQTFTPDGAE